MIQAAAVAGAAGKTVANVGSGLSKLLGSYDREADARRQANNRLALQLAQRGNATAWRYLGLRGNVIPGPESLGPLALDGQVISEGGLTGRWASPPATEQAAELYRGLAPKFSGVPLTNPGEARADVGGIDPVTGQPLAAPTSAGMTGGVLLLVAVIGVILLAAGRD